MSKVEPVELANFKSIDVLDILVVANPQKSTKECGSISTRAPETARNTVPHKSRKDGWEFYSVVSAVG